MAGTKYREVSVYHPDNSRGPESSQGPIKLTVLTLGNKTRDQPDSVYGPPCRPGSCAYDHIRR